MKIVSVVGTRPNFMKIAPLVAEFKKYNVEHVLIHTGQHYDATMNQLFFDDLDIPKPDINLGVGSGTYADQIGHIVLKLEPVLKKEKPDLVVVVGDVNSTLAGALIAKQLGMTVAHVEAGLRSFDLTMPEEINRMLTDRIADYLFTTEKSGNDNLQNEGISNERIFFTGNVMIDTLQNHKEKAQSSDILTKLQLNKKDYLVLTLHRPSNVDNKEQLSSILSLLKELQHDIPIVFPIHPRTNKNIAAFALDEQAKQLDKVIMTEPLGYLDFLHLMANSKLVLTDSGGIQEETTVLGVPCITMRETTERPITAEQGTNLLVSTDMQKIKNMVKMVLDGKMRPKGTVPEKWDGKAAERIARILCNK